MGNRVARAYRKTEVDPKVKKPRTWGMIRAERAVAQPVAEEGQ